MRKLAVKKKTSGTRGSVRAKKNPRTIDAYIARVPEPARTTLSRVRSVIRSAVPAKAVEIISYGMPAFKHKGVVVWFAAFSNHCSLFPTSSIIELFKNELKDFPTAKGTIHFPLDKPLPAALLRKIVKARVAEIERKNRS
jgi:uncharacterized protein YdhG (YjbR/CyaY superfamily)